MNTPNVFLLLNGEKPTNLPDISKYELICATDGAYQYLKENQIQPHFISGDFDSLATLPKDIETIHTPDQNFTDFDKILQILFDRNFKNIHVYGASGKEQDHFLGNLHTALQWQKKLNITFLDDYGRYFFGDKEMVLSSCLNKIVSLLPFPTATKITTQGLLYPLQNETLTFGAKIGTRNKATKKEVNISFETGELLIFMHH
ncbi:MAG: Thiamine pyrophosphokinase [Polaribacter sp. SA4-10]|nr:MAG: Thiamine pyrophosphokinase [Polaribacter sp. SA4-10]